MRNVYVRPGDKIRDKSKDITTDIMHTSCLGIVSGKRNFKKLSQTDKPTNWRT